MLLHLGTAVLLDGSACLHLLGCGTALRVLIRMWLILLLVFHLACRRRRPSHQPEQAADRQPQALRCSIPPGALNIMLPTGSCFPLGCLLAVAQFGAAAARLLLLQRLCSHLMTPLQLSWRCSRRRSRQPPLASSCWTLWQSTLLRRR